MKQTYCCFLQNIGYSNYCGSIERILFELQWLVLHYFKLAVNKSVGDFEEEKTSLI